MKKLSNEEKIRQLPCWRGEIRSEILSGGITNQNFKVSDSQGVYVVRLGDDIYEHLISRANELAASKAAADIDISPKVVYSQPGILVIQFIEGKVFSAEDIRCDTNLSRIVSLLRSFHQQMTSQFRGFPVMFWVFNVINHYRHILIEGESKHLQSLSTLLNIANQLEFDIGPVKIVYGHNDLLPANFIDDGKKIWLIDYDYAGFNSPLFDLANLASNSELSSQQERNLLNTYFDKQVSESLWKSFQAMKCASLLREGMWSMVSEIHSEIDFDYSVYTRENMERFDAVYAEYQAEFH